MLAGKDALENSAAAEVVSFQLWGLDFMVDAEFDVTLLEANVSPACAQALLPQFAEDFVHAVLDPLFPPTTTVAHSGGGGEEDAGGGAASDGASPQLHVDTAEALPGVPFRRGFDVIWSPGGAGGAASYHAASSDQQLASSSVLH
jgi:hypothetical protein